MVEDCTMKQTRIRIYRNDGDTLEICETLHEKSGRWCGDFSKHDEKTRYTPNGRPWVDITCGDECPHCDAGRDGGKCSFFRREKQKDVIAVCFCEKLRVEPEKLFTQKRLE